MYSFRHIIEQNKGVSIKRNGTPMSVEKFEEELRYQLMCRRSGPTVGRILIKRGPTYTIQKFSNHQSTFHETKDAQC